VRRRDFIALLGAAALALEPDGVRAQQPRIYTVVVQPTLPLQHVADLAVKYQLPAGSPSMFFALDGGLLAYSINGDELYHRAAAFVDKILKGAKPADLPVEQATQYLLIINQRTAKALSLTIPRQLLLRADRVIE